MGPGLESLIHGHTPNGNTIQSVYWAVTDPVYFNIFNMSLKTGSVNFACPEHSPNGDQKLVESDAQ
jgi:hypothetical protein